MYHPNRGKSSFLNEISTMEKINIAFESFQFRLTTENKGLQNLLIWLNLNDQNVPCSQSKVMTNI
jgi:hypothetical protein